MRGAQGTGRKAGEAIGWAFLWLHSCRDKKVTRRRAASGIKAVEVSPEAIQQSPLTLTLSLSQRERDSGWSRA